MQHRNRLAIPEPVAELSASLATALPNAEVKIDRPRDPEGEWWLDVSCDGFRSSIAWRAKQGFGLFTRPAEFADRPDEIYHPPALAAKRLSQLYENQKTSSEPIPLWLTEIRRLRGTPQTSIAEKLSQSQAAISQLERREDIRLSTLRRYVQAMGGRLEMKVVFEEFSAVVDVVPSDKSGER